MEYNLLMPKLVSNDAFTKSVNPWTLSFLSSEDEATFRAANLAAMDPPPFIIGAVYFALGLHITYRIMGIVASFTNIGIDTAGFRVEGGLLAYILVSYTIEIILRYKNWLPYVHGFFVYTSLPTVLITAAFYTRLTPYFGIAYFLVTNV